MVDLTYPLLASVFVALLLGPTQAVPLSCTDLHAPTNCTAPVAVSTSAPKKAAPALNPNATDCQLAIPANALTAEGLSAPWELLPPCSQAVGGQQAFAEAAFISSTGQISIYHPLIIDQGSKPPVAPVVPKVDDGTKVALFFGFNGNTLTLVDTNGKDTNDSPILADLKCVNGLPGVKGDVFGQVSWCNTAAFWNATNAAVASNQLKVPQLGTDRNGNQCLSSRSFEIIDQDQSDNLPTKYLLLADGRTVQFTAANQKQFPTATEIDNASDEALIGDIVDPVIGCTPFRVASVDDPGVMVPSLATQELQALLYQAAPIAIVPLNDPDTVLTANGAESPEKTNAYRVGVNQPLLGTGDKTDAGSGVEYCNNMIAKQPPFLAGFQTDLTKATTPDATVGNNLFTFLANRFLQSITNLKCANKNIPVTCQLDGAGVATACSIAAASSTGQVTTKPTPSSGKGSSVSVAKQSTTNAPKPSSGASLSATPSRHVKSHGFGTKASGSATSTNAVISTRAATHIVTSTSDFATSTATSVPATCSQATQAAQTCFSIPIAGWQLCRTLS